MERKHLILLTACLLVMSTIIIALYAFSPLGKEIRPASFIRNFPTQPVIEQKAVMDIKYNSYYISGATSDNIYLSNYTALEHLLVTNVALTDSQHVRLKIIGLDSILRPGKFRTVVDSPYFYLTHGLEPCLLRGTIGNWHAARFMPDSAYFVEAIPISPSSFALRSYSNISKGYELARQIADSPHFEFKYDLLEKQIDGLFCVEGKIHYSESLKQLVYLYSYRNQYIVADTNFDLVYRAHTIDTFSRARVKVTNIESENASMLSSPPTNINGLSCVSGKYLFVQSNLLAKNEDKEEFINGVVIDAYDLVNRTYSFSFHLRDHRNKKLSDFKVFKNQLVAIFDQYLVIYEFKPKNFLHASNLYWKDL